MKKQGSFVSLDIGTTSIKVVVAEYVNNQLNVIGVGNEVSKGLNRGVIVDIDETVASIKKAVEQAEKKSGIKIQNVVVGIPGNQIGIEPCHGMYAVSSENKEITDRDVQNVFEAARVRSLPPEREIISVIPEEFIVDGFDGIRDPRGMIGVRLELYASMITGPKTIIHNIKRCVERAGLVIQDMVVQPLAISSIAMNRGERDFGTILIDMGGGQTTASVMHDDQLKFVFVDPEGGNLVTKDISIILNTTMENAEYIKREYGYAISDDASDSEFFQVPVIGKEEPVKVDEKYLSEIIEARVVQIFNTIKHALDEVEALELPGGIVLTGGGSIIPGVAALAEEIFEVNVKHYIPEEMGMRTPVFATSLGLIKYMGEQDEINLVAKKKVNKPVQEQVKVVPMQQKQPKPIQAKAEPVQEKYSEPVDGNEKPSFMERAKQFIQSIFE